MAKCYLNEPGADQVRALARAAGGLCSLELARVEFACVLRRHVREGHLREVEAKEAHADFRRDEKAGVWRWFAVSSLLIEKACVRLGRLPKQRFLRALDALHLECARDNGFERVHTNDRHMLENAVLFDLEGIDVIKTQRVR